MSKQTRSMMVLMVAGVAAVLLAAPAMASPVRFDNPVGPAHFDWSEPYVEVGLDLALPADDPGQPPAPDSPSSMTQMVVPADGITFMGGNAWGQVVGDFDWAVGVNAGELITGTGSWALSPTVYFEAFGGSQLPENVEIYLPVAFDPYGEPGTSCTVNGPDCHFGWIGVVRTGMELDAFAWGYETLPNTPIPAGAPEPGTLALLAMGAVGVLGRRRN